MPWVIKIGGSLYASRRLQEWLDTLQALGSHQLVIVPGGGPFADRVRDADKQFGLEPALAHHMAVLAMQQFAYLMVSLCPGLQLASSREEIHACWEEGETAIWEPYPLVSRQCELPKTWEVTSDSLAAWLAGHLSVTQLLFVKSAPQTLSGMTVSQLQALGCVDTVLPGLLAGSPVNAHFLHKSKAGEFEQWLGRDAP